MGAQEYLFLSRHLEKVQEAWIWQPVWEVCLGEQAQDKAVLKPQSMW